MQVKRVNPKDFPLNPLQDGGDLRANLECCDKSWKSCQNSLSLSQRGNPSVSDLRLFPHPASLPDSIGRNLYGRQDHFSSTKHGTVFVDCADSINVHHEHKCAKACPLWVFFQNKSNTGRRVSSLGQPWWRWGFCLKYHMPCRTTMVRLCSKSSLHHFQTTIHRCHKPWSLWDQAPNHLRYLKLSSNKVWSYLAWEKQLP